MTLFNAQTTGDEVVEAFASSVAGKTILITGPSEHGLGAQTALSLAVGKPRRLILVGRSLTKIQPVIDEINSISPSTEVIFEELDLTNLSSVKKAAKGINGKIEKLDILVNNAGVMAVKDYEKSVDGIEMQFAANHIGHFLLTNLLMDKIFAAEGARVVNVSSGGYVSSGIRFEDWNFKDGKEYNPWLGYGQSKTANILFASALAEKLKGKGVLAFSVDPGLVVDTKLQTHVTPEMFGEGYEIAVAAMNGEPLHPLDPKTLAQGASTTLYAALAPELKEHSGAFLQNCADSTETLLSHAKGASNRDQLWALSEKLVGEIFAYA
ncbi:NAD(P)-binding protein [Hyaloscypha bicolor E]|uniref:NAD(P)-binding protein n=1 Tax=Hyaloscypha bicolor E TaxID=1095630 RepID=A0A2J6STG6_9HELO|nr:NAD(P)-binding protein [Hyaloscypha bicolor E]PMD54086.1 NAD(P)-binding protein [Hyaloscypha bicolor E]